MNSKHFTSALATLVALALFSADAYGYSQDAYGHIDSFGGITGIEIADGFSNVNGTMIATEQEASLVSTCIDLTIPASASFNGWEFADIWTEVDASSVTDQTVEIQRCDGTPLLTVGNDDLSATCNAIDLSALPAVPVRIAWHVSHRGTPGTDGVTGAAVTDWRVIAKTSGPTTVAVSGPETITSGETMVVAVQVGSSGATTRDATLRLSLDRLNDLDSDGDNGLAEDAEHDYGNGAGLHPVHPVQFVRASSLAGHVPSTPAVDATRGVVEWTVGDIADGVTEWATVDIRVPRGTAPGKRIAFEAILDYGLRACDSHASLTSLTELVADSVGSETVVEAHADATWYQWSPIGQVSVRTKNIRDSHYLRTGTAEVRTGDAELVRMTIEPVSGDGSCAAVFQSFTYSGRGEGGIYAKRVISEPASGAVWTEPLVVEFDRMTVLDDWIVNVNYDVGPGCVPGNHVGSVGRVTIANPDTAERVVTRTHPVVEETACRGGYSHFHRAQIGEQPQYKPWPGWPEYYVTGGQIQPGHFFTQWTPYGNGGYRRHTFRLDHSYFVFTVPDHVSYHGTRLSHADRGRVYKDCSGSALLPTAVAFKHTAPELSGWSLVDTGGDLPLTGEAFDEHNDPRDDNPSAIVPPGCRIMAIKDGDDPAGEGDNGHWVNESIFQVCDGSFCPAPEVGATVGLNSGKIYTYETFTDAAGVAHDCGATGGSTIKIGAASYPRVYVDGQPEVPAGQTAKITLTPENHNRASQYVDGVWAFDLYPMRSAIDLANVTGRVMTEGAVLPPEGANVAGESCDPEQIIFHPPDPSFCLAPGDLHCYAWWEVPAACQPPNGFGRQVIGNHSYDGYQPSLQFELSAPVRRSVPAGTELSFAGQIRASDLSSLGAENAIEPETWSADNYLDSATVLVLPTPALDVSLNGPSAVPAGQSFTHDLTLTNTGNVALDGAYVVSQLPKAGVGGSTVTPLYGRLRLDSEAATTAVEYSEDTDCFVRPLQVGWNALELRDSAEDGFASELADVIPSSATCVRIYRTLGESIAAQAEAHCAIELTVPADVAPEDTIRTHALAGASPAIAGDLTVSPVEATPTTTYTREEPQIDVDLAATTDMAQPDVVRWTVSYRNVSGALGQNIRLTMNLPDELTFGSIVSETLSGVESCVNADCSVVEANPNGTGGEVILLVSAVAGLNPVADTVTSGDISFVTYGRAALAKDATITAKATAEVDRGRGDTAEVTLRMATIEVEKTVKDLSESSVVSLGQAITYQIAVTNVSDAITYQQVTFIDELPNGVTFISGTLRLEGASISDQFVKDGVLNYTIERPFAPGERMVLSFMARVDDTQREKTILNIGGAQVCELADDSICSPTLESIPAKVDVEFVCGDGFLSANEGCDDGNHVDGDGCSASCVVEITLTTFDDPANNPTVPEPKTDGGSGRPKAGGCSAANQTFANSPLLLICLVWIVRRRIRVA